jgi:glycosyl transferase family 1
VTPPRSPLSGLRLVVTLPPPHFFGGLDRRRADDHAAALRALGASIYELSTEAVYRNDKAALARQIAEIHVFAPDAVIGTPHAGYALQGGMIAEPDSGGGTSRNLFLDLLKVPTILYWDHVLTQAARYLIPSWPGGPQESVPDVAARLKHLLMHPLAVHFFPDSGHVAELERMGLATFDDQPIFVTAVSQDFVRHGAEAKGAPLRPEELAFFGNLYLAATSKVAYVSDPSLAQVRRDALARCVADWDLPAFDAYARTIAALPPERRATLKLEPDQSFFWRFFHDELSIVANGQRRFDILATCNRPVAFYGGFADPQSAEAVASRQWLLRESLPHDRSLAEAYRSASVTIDVVNAPFINGFSPKVLECFASGGFLLTTRKKDINRTFGDLGDTISYSSPGELAAKIEHFLSHETERRSIMREMQEIIRRDHTAAALFARTVPAAIDRIRARRR